MEVCCEERGRCCFGAEVAREGTNGKWNGMECRQCNVSYLGTGNVM